MLNQAGETILDRKRSHFIKQIGKRNITCDLLDTVFRQTGKTYLSFKGKIYLIYSLQNFQ